MTTTVNARPSQTLFDTLTDLARAFGNAQRSVQSRIEQIRTGNFIPVSNGRRRRPVQELLSSRDEARDDLRNFLTGMTDDERNMVAIGLANRDWEVQVYEMLNPEWDPSL